MELLEMSKKELSRIEVMERMKAKKMTQQKGAEALGLSVRQVRWLTFTVSNSQGHHLAPRFPAIPARIHNNIKRLNNAISALARLCDGVSFFFDLPPLRSILAVSGSLL